jgi:RNA-directed DNA polymerase
VRLGGVRLVAAAANGGSGSELCPPDSATGRLMSRRRPWYQSGGYKHFDISVGEGFAAKTECAGFIAKHSWLPLIGYTKRIKKYRRKDGKTVYKERPIMYASHRDSCILKRYARDLTVLLDKRYAESGLNDAVIAYRKLGKANYHFAAQAYEFAKKASPCAVLCFDITGFFDNLNHGVLKDRLKRILGVKELSKDWYAVFRAVSQYRSVDRGHLEDHPVFGRNFADRSRKLIASIQEIRDAGIAIAPNPNKFGIPQGTPISSVFANLYLLDFDEAMVAMCTAVGALYQRYSDDILIVCPVNSADELAAFVEKGLVAHGLKLAAEKTDKQIFDPEFPAVFQYLGFNISPDGAVIRHNSLARQWRKAKRAIDRTRKIGLTAIVAGRADKIFVQKLRRRFSPVGSRNFSSYSRRADDAFGSRKIARQVARLERKVDAEIRSLQLIQVPKPD